jgi:hypothetical protein
MYGGAPYSAGLPGAASYGQAPYRGLTADGVGNGLLPSSWGGEDAAEHAQILKVSFIVTLHSNYTRALTFEIFCFGRR